MCHGICSTISTKLRNHVRSKPLGGFRLQGLAQMTGKCTENEAIGDGLVLSLLAVVELISEFLKRGMSVVNHAARAVPRLEMFLGMLTGLHTLYF
jgi:hypothetical protein